MTNLDAIKVQEYAVKNNLTFEQAGKALGFSPEMVEEMQAGLNNNANWGNVGEKTEFSQKNEKYLKVTTNTQKRAEYYNDMVQSKKEMKENWANGNYLAAIGNALEGTVEAFRYESTPKQDGVQQAGIGKLLVPAALAAVVFASCSEGDTYINTEEHYTDSNTFNIKLQDEAAIIAAMEKGFEALESKLTELGYTIASYGDKIIDLLVKNNQQLKTIADQLEKQGQSQEKIIEILTNIDNTTQRMEVLLGDVSNDNKDIKEQVTQINKKLLNVNTLPEGVEDLKDLLIKIIENQDNSYNVQLETGVDVKEILKKLENLNITGGTTDLSEILDILNKIKGVTENIEAKLDELNENIKNIQISSGNDPEVAKYLKQILEATKDNGAKIDETNRLLAKIQNENADFQKLVLAALAEISGTAYETKDLVNAILKKFNNLQVGGGGTVDLSTVEDLLKLILDAVKENGGKLDGITEQNKTIITILSSFKKNAEDALAKIEKATTNIAGDVTEVKGFFGDIKAKLQEILDKMGQGEGCNLDFDKLMNKLDDILAAIKDHKVEVDVTGKVTCECNCGEGTHEGVLGDLNDILG